MQKDESSEGIALESTSCIIALAFVVEGILNVVGARLDSSWQERQPYSEKLRYCMGELGVSDLSEEPFATLEMLKEFRDQVAHPKPRFETVEVDAPSEIFAHMDAPWEKVCNPGFALAAFEQVDAFERMVLEHPKIDEHAFMTQAFGLKGSWC